jgi:hypothetical protein
LVCFARKIWQPCVAARLKKFLKFSKVSSAWQTGGAIQGASKYS